MPKMTTKQAIFVVIGIIIIGLGWFFWRQQANKVPEGFIVAGGRIEGREVNVSSRVQGRILKLMADEGNTVKKGQILAVLDSEQIQAQVASAQENLKTAQKFSGNQIIRFFVQAFCLQVRTMHGREIL